MAKKKNTRKPKVQHSDAWPLVLGLALLIIIVTILITLLSQDKVYPVKTSVPAAMAAFRAQNVSEIILSDLAADFSSGNYSIKELKQKYPGFEADIDAVNTHLGSSESEVVAVVNGEQISRTELERQLSLLPPQLQQYMGEEQVLAQMIDEKLLLQEAKKRGIEPTAEDIDAAYMKLLEQGGLTEEQLLQNVASYGLSVDDIRTMLVQQQTVTLLLDDAVEKSVNVTEAQKRAYYEQNKDAFATDDQVTVRHILISSQQSTPEAAYEEAQGVLARIEGGEEFCDLVTEFSDDAGSKDNCGEYTFGRGYMVPEFEEISFRLNPGEIGIVNTSFGSHVVEKISASNASVPTYDEVEPQIADQLANGQRTVAYQDFIESLRADATIVNYLTTPGSAVDSNVILDVDDGEVIIDDMDSNAINAQVNITEPVQSVETNEPAENISESVTEPEETTEPVEEIPEAAEPAESGELSTADLAACLGKKATLYTSSWATSSMKEAQKFGDDAEKLTVVDCAEKDCPVSAYPAWEINGTVHLGAQSFEALAQMAKC